MHLSMHIREQEGQSIRVTMPVNSTRGIATFSTLKGHQEPIELQRVSCHRCRVFFSRPEEARQGGHPEPPGEKLGGRSSLPWAFLCPRAIGKGRATAWQATMLGQGQGSRVSSESGGPLLAALVAIGLDPMKPRIQYASRRSLAKHG